MFDLNFLIFGILPYAVLAIALIGTIARYERDPYTWKASSSQLLRRKQLIWGSILFHVGIIVLFFGHLIGLFTPVWVLDGLGISYGFKQWMAVIIGGLAGAAAFVGCTMLLHRRLSDPRIRNNSTYADIGILALLWVQIVVGMGTIVLTLQHMDGAKMLQFMAWSQSVMGLQINAWQQVVDVHWLYKLHIFLGMVILVLFPFTRLVHMLSVPVRFLWRPGYQIVRSRHGAKPVRTGLKPFTPPQPGPRVAPPVPPRPEPVPVPAHGQPAE
jgi:nitrate reductase gamma subunit